MNRFLYLLSAALVLLVGLSACSNTNNALIDLPLADDKPTFLFFYTDN